MGYYTDYELTVTGDIDHDQLLDTLSEITGYTWDNDLTLSDVKWYDYKGHMKIISTMFPDVVFTLHGDGEENGDIWQQYFKNGKSQYAKAEITFEKFDEFKLK